MTVSRRSRQRGDERPRCPPPGASGKQQERPARPAALAQQPRTPPSRRIPRRRLSLRGAATEGADRSAGGRGQRHHNLHDADRQGDKRGGERGSGGSGTRRRDRPEPVDRHAPAASARPGSEPYSMWSGLASRLRRAPAEDEQRDPPAQGSEGRAPPTSRETGVPPRAAGSAGGGAPDRPRSRRCANGRGSPAATTRAGFLRGNKDRRHVLARSRRSGTRPGSRPGLESGTAGASRGTTTSRAPVLRVPLVSIRSPSHDLRVRPCARSSPRRRRRPQDRRCSAPEPVRSRRAPPSYAAGDHQDVRPVQVCVRLGLPRRPSSRRSSLVEQQAGGVAGEGRELLPPGRRARCRSAGGDRAGVLGCARAATRVALSSNVAHQPHRSPSATASEDVARRRRRAGRYRADEHGRAEVGVAPAGARQALTTAATHRRADEAARRSLASRSTWSSTTTSPGRPGASAAGMTRPTRARPFKGSTLE